jgi:NAD(P)-dependent dehydrogenase (short-subunit alcohol dehydrogenase family)
MNSPSSATHCLVITGASRGIGLAIASRFVDSGYRVVNLSRTLTPVPGAVQISVDLAQSAELDAIAMPLVQAVGGAEILTVVHNAALQLPGGVGDILPSQLRAMFEINVVAPTVLNRILLPHMRPGSAIIYIGSTLSVRATRQMAGYATTKHALVGLMRSTCQDVAGTGIHTCCICPGFTDTEMLRSYGGDALQHLASLSTQKRLILPAEIADFVHFAATHPVVNGAALSADLGFIEP